MSAPLQIIINPSDDAPIYRQIVRQVREALAVGRLAGGDPVPSHRKLAQQLVVAPLTIKKAYDELERAGLLVTLRGRGTFVAADVQAGSAEESRKELQSIARRLVHEAQLARISSKELGVLIAEEQRHLEEQQKAMQRRAESS